MHYGDSLGVECPLVVHSFLQCIVGLNECTRKHPLWFRTPLKMAVPSNSALFEGIGAISDTALVFPCTGVDTMADSSQFTQGGSNVRWSCQSTIVGGVCAELHHSDRALRTA